MNNRLQNDRHRTAWNSIMKIVFLWITNSKSKAQKLVWLSLTKSFELSLFLVKPLDGHVRPRFKRHKHFLDEDGKMFAKRRPNRKNFPLNAEIWQSIRILYSNFIAKVTNFISNGLINWFIHFHVESRWVSMKRELTIKGFLNSLWLIKICLGLQSSFQLWIAKLSRFKLWSVVLIC